MTEIKVCKKASRKLKRCEEILLKHENLKISVEPTEALFVGNGGLDCGIQRETLVEIFNRYGPLRSIVLLPGKPYAFVVFGCASHSKDALEAIHGRPLDCGHTFYIAFIKSEDVPKEEIRLGERPSGLILLENFISEEDERMLLSEINFDNDSDDKNVLKHRRVKHYGYEFIYGSNNINKNRPMSEKIPEVCIPHLQRLKQLGHISHMPDQLTVNHYLPGQGIPPHIDTHSAFEDGLVSLSLGSQVVMDFYCAGKESVPVLLPQRSALIMSGESRYLWKHGITPRKTDIVTVENQLTLQQRDTRISLTFRKIRDSPCQCDFKGSCDSQNMQKSTVSMIDLLSNKDAKELERKYVNEVYEEIADHFSDTRYKPWPKVASFIRSVPPGSIILDVGCGNGKNLKLSSSCFEVGCDTSSNLASVCAKRNIEVLVADCLNLPYRDNSFDVVLSIAVIHHMSTEPRRSQAVREILRVLRPKSKALIYVWAFEQNSPHGPSNYLKTSTENSEVEKLEDTSSKITLNDKELTIQVHVNRTLFASHDMLVPWKSHEGKVNHRYYHLFKPNEIDELVKLNGGLILDSYYDKGNWCVVLQK